MRLGLPVLRGRYDAYLCAQHSSTRGLATLRHTWPLWVKEVFVMVQMMRQKKLPGRCCFGNSTGAGGNGHGRHSQLAMEILGHVVYLDAHPSSQVVYKLYIYIYIYIYTYIYICNYMCIPEQREWLIPSYTMDISHLMHPQMPNISWPWNIGNMMISDSWGKMPKSGTLGHMLGRHHLQCGLPRDVCVFSPPHEYFTVVFAYHKL